MSKESVLVETYKNVPIFYNARGSLFTASAEGIDHTSRSIHSVKRAILLSTSVKLFDQFSIEPKIGRARFQNDDKEVLSVKGFRKGTQSSNSTPLLKVVDIHGASWSFNALSESHMLCVPFNDPIKADIAALDAEHALRVKKYNSRRKVLLSRLSVIDVKSHLDSL